MSFFADFFGKSKKDKKIQQQQHLKSNMVAQVKAHQKGWKDKAEKWDGKQTSQIKRNPYPTVGGKRRRTRKKRRKSRRKRRKSRKKRRKSRRKRRR